MKEHTIETLLLFGIVFVSLGIVLWLARQYMKAMTADTAKWVEAFQGAARGGAAPMYRGDYDRPRYAKETRAQNPYAQKRYKQAVEDITNSQIRYIRIEGGNDYLTLSYLAVYSNTGEELSQKSSVSSSGEYNHCRPDWKFGRSWIAWEPNRGCDTCGAWYVKNGDIRNKDFYTLYHSSGGNAWLEMTLDKAYWLDRVVVYNRRDWDTHRLAYYKIKFYDNNKKLLFERNLTADQQQTFAMPAHTCRAGYRHVGGRDSRCIQNCASTDTADNTNQICYQPCAAGEFLDGGAGGTCKVNRPAGFTLSDVIYYKDCVAPDTQLDTANCYRPCAAGEDSSRPPKCYRVCPPTHRLIEDQCFPNDPYTYLPIAWFGPILSQAETGRNMGLTQSLGKQNGAAVGLWGSISETATSKNYATDQLWAYTEDMELICMETRKCMDTGGEAPSMMNCTKGENQKWVVDSEGRIRSKQDLNRCITVTDWSARPTGEPITQLTINKKVSLQPCTPDRGKFQRWKIPAERVGLNQAVGNAAAPPPLPSEPLNRDGFIGTQAEPLNRDGFTNGGSGNKSSGATDNAF